MEIIQVLFNCKDNMYVVKKYGCCSFYNGSGRLPKDILAFIKHNEPKIVCGKYTFWKGALQLTY